MTGVLIIDKPTGPTSHDVVTMVKKRLGARKVGHIGTLDPLATGVLPLCINEATKLARFLEKGEKEYLATIKLGEETDTYDSEGVVVAKGDITSITKESIVSAINDFKGRIKQIPPMFSAVKMDGVPLYKLARQCVTVERKPRDVEIYSIDITNITLPFITINAICSRGTYIRSLAFDIGRKLGCGAHLVSLRRMKSGMFSLKDSISINDLKDLQEDILHNNIIPVERLFSNIPDIEVDTITANKIMDGMAPNTKTFSAGVNFFSSVRDNEMIRFTANGRIIALATYKGEEGFKLERVLKNSEAHPCLIHAGAGLENRR
ncbi:MAG TPA: tRNA pseudouridine(55) synthase TruB [Thermodesulfobacteriota bacterium]|nr:tRNA pseudouridine(55) synthase TruB [Thermodesulfobacteriota bacterium]